MGILAYRLSMKTEIVTGGSRVRVPDLVVFSEELAKAMEGAQRSTASTVFAGLKLTAAQVLRG